MNTREERLLRVAFLKGRLTDAGALLPMLWPRLGELLWAHRRPLERRFVAALTVLVICGLILTEVVAVHSGALEAWRMLPTWCVQAVLLLLFAGAVIRLAPPSRSTLSGNGA